MSTLVGASCCLLEADNPKKEIAMYINSPGGVVTSGPAIYDHDAFQRAGRCRRSASAGYRLDGLAAPDAAC